MEVSFSIASEQINETPLLLSVMEDMGVRKVIDRHIRAHGSWKGASGLRLPALPTRSTGDESLHGARD